MRVKSDFIKHSRDALINIENFAIHETRVLINYIVVNGIADFGSELMIQLLGRLNILCKIADIIRDNIKKVQDPENSDKGIMIGNRIDLYNLSRNFNKTELLSKSFNITDINSLRPNALNKEEMKNYNGIHKETAGILDASGAVAFEISLYTLKKDWTGTIFSGLAGIGQILIGVSLIALSGGAFSVAFGYGLVSGGVGDILSSFMSVMNGTPIDMNDYMKSKSFELAINVVPVSYTHLTLPTIYSV